MSPYYGYEHRRVLLASVWHLSASEEIREDFGSSFTKG